MTKKLSVDFIMHNEPVIKDVANAQLIELMVTITRIGLRANNPEIKSDVIIKKENQHDSKKNK